MECDVNIKNRLKRSEGQLRGILNMMDEQQDCKDIITQLCAVRSSVDRIIALITVHNLKEQIEQQGISNEEDIKKAVDLLMKSR